MRLNRNLRQSRAEERVLGGKRVAQVARPPEAQPFRGFRPFWNNGYQGGFHGVPREGLGGDLRRREGGQGARDPNAMDVDREGSWRDERKCYNCGKFRNIAQYYRNPREVRGETLEVSKDQEDQ